MILVNILLLLIGLLIVLLIWLSISPLVLRIDTEEEIYYIKLSGIGKAQLLFSEDFFLLRIRVFFLPFTIDPFKPRKKKKKKKPKKKKEPGKKKLPKGFREGGNLFAAAFRSFTIKQFQVNLDTGDVIRNAFLFPVMTFLNTESFHVTINNTGNNSARIIIQNRLINLLFLYLKFRFRSK